MKVSPCIEVLEARIAPAAAVLNLGDLNGADGFKLSGVAMGDESGFSVSEAGDVNGDGFGDVIVGARFADEGGLARGAAYVVFGKDGGFGANLALSALDGSNGFKLSGVGDTYDAGFSVSAAGDVNGDGFDDLLIGALHAGEGGFARGAAYVVFGKAGGFGASVALSGLDGTNGFKLSGVADSDYAGSSVSAAGDVNGDGFDDVLVGAFGADPNGTYSGASYVIFGKVGGFTATLNLSSLDGTNGFKLNGEAAGDQSGRSVSGAGDVNDDGFADVIIGAQDADPNGNASGAGYVVFGKDTAVSGDFPAVLELSALDGTIGFRISLGTPDSLSGASVSGAGDVNRDGFDDVIIGAPGTDDFGVSTGAAYVVFGKAGGFAANLDIQAFNLDPANGFKVSGVAAGDKAGSSVSVAGDVNGDGFADLLIGAYGFDPNGSGANGSYFGASYVVYGNTSAFFSSHLNLSALDGSNGFQISGEESGDRFGRSVSGAGDVNGDGFDDLLIGAFGANPNGSESGASYVVFGFDPRVTISPNGKTATITDADGDVFKAKVSKGTLTAQDFVIADDGSITSIDLTRSQAVAAAAAGGAAGQAPFDFILKLKKRKGNGLVNVGAIDATGLNVGTLKIAGDLGQLAVGAGIVGQQGLGQLVIGSLTGDGTVAGTVGTLKIKHDLKGVLNVTGGPADEVGQVESSAVFINKVVIAGDLDGSSGGAKAGLLRVRGGIGSVVVKGSVIGGADLSGIVVGGSVGKIMIAGDLTSADPAKPVTIGALGDLAADTAEKAVAIKKLTIGGAVLNAQILAGYKRDLTPFNADAGIGKITVAGDWSASSVAAGIADSTGDGFGRNDTVIAGDATPALFSRIASIVISGTATGSSSSGTDFFGITAQEIGSAKIHGVNAAFTPNKDDLDLDPANGDFRLAEV